MSVGGLSIAEQHSPHLSLYLYNVQKPGVYVLTLWAMVQIEKTTRDRCEEAGVRRGCCGLMSKVPNRDKGKIEQTDGSAMLVLVA